MERLHQPLLPGSAGSPLHRLPRADGPLALVPHPHRRLPHLSKPESSRHHPEDFQGLGFSRFQAAPLRRFHDSRLLRAVPRDGFQLRLPADGRRGHLLLLRAAGWQAHADSGERSRRARAVSATRKPPATIFGAAASSYEDVVTEWHYQEEFRPGKWAQTDYNFETPSTQPGGNGKRQESLRDL